MKTGWQNFLLIPLLLAQAAAGMAWANDEPKDRRLRQAIERAERQIPQTPQPQYAVDRGPPGTLLNRAAPAAPEEPQNAARLSQDERRTLRRQIHEAGRELYPPPAKGARGP